MRTSGRQPGPGERATAAQGRPRETEGKVARGKKDLDPEEWVGPRGASKSGSAERSVSKADPSLPQRGLGEAPAADHCSLRALRGGGKKLLGPRQILTLLEGERG